MACLCYTVFVASAGRHTGWGLETSEGSLLICLKIDAGYGLGTSVHLCLSLQMVSPHSLVWIFSQYGDWVLKIKFRECV